MGPVTNVTTRKDSEKKTKIYKYILRQEFVVHFSKKTTNNEIKIASDKTYVKETNKYFFRKKVMVLFRNAT